jgi:ELWxxDGT repeat protein
MVDDILSGSYGSYPTNLTNVGGVLLFSANDGSHGYELWQSDGSAAGTVLAKDIDPGSAGSVSSGSYYGADFTNVGGTLFFAANDGTTGSELWKATPPVPGGPTPTPPAPTPPTPVPPTPSVTSVTSSGSSASVSVSCTGAEGTDCEVTVTLSVTETIKGGKVIAIASKAKPHKPKAKHKTVVIGTSTETLAAGTKATVTVVLNGAGKHLLATRHKLNAKLSVKSSGNVIDTQTVTFKLKKPTKHKH